MLRLSSLLFLASILYGQAVVGTLSRDIRTNDHVFGYNGMSVTGTSNYNTGDTWSATWSNDGNVYGTFNDGAGPPTHQGTAGRNLGIVKYNTDLTSPTFQNTMDDFGTGACTYNGAQGVNSCASGNYTLGTNWTDSATWKSRGGIASVNGVLYHTVQRQTPGSPFNSQNSSLEKSYDHGLTWCNYTHATPTGCSGNQSVSGKTGDVLSNGQQMWTDPNFRTPTIVQYCQDNSMNCPTVDNNGTYTYLTSSASSSTGERLMRVLTADLPKLDVTLYSYWTNAAGDGNINNAANWSTSSTGALPIFTGKYLGNSHVYYISALGRYVALTWEFQEFQSYSGWFSNSYLMSATSLTGPWTQTKVFPDHEDYICYLGLFLNTVTVVSNNPLIVTVKVYGSGDYTLFPGMVFTNPSDPSQMEYSLRIRTLTLSLASSSLNGQRKFELANSSVPFVEKGLVQMFDFSPTPTTTTVQDISGQGNNGTALYQPLYSKSGMGSFDGQSFYVDTGQNYGGQSDYTYFIAFRHIGPISSNETLVGNGSVTSKLALMRDASTADNFKIYAGASSSTDVNETDGVWGMLIVQKAGTTVNVYDPSQFNANGTSATAKVTLAGVTANVSSGEILLGWNSGFTALGTAQSYVWSGEIAYWAFYNRALSTTEIWQDITAIQNRLAQRGVYFPRQIWSYEKAYDAIHPKGVWSVRKVLSNYNGNAMLVRRASDGTTQAIPFTASGDIDITGTGPLMTFCAATTCTVQTWYDQSISGYDLTQATLASQPTVVSSGTVVTNGTAGHLALSFSGAQQLQENSFFHYGLTGAAGVVASLNSGAVSAAQVFSITPGLNDTNSGLWAAMTLGRTTTLATLNYGHGGQTLTTGSQTYGASSVYLFGDDTTKSRVWMDGNTTVSGTMGRSTSSYMGRFNMTQMTVGGFGPSNYWNGTISEVVFVPYALGGTTTTALKPNLKAYFGTP